MTPRPLAGEDARRVWLEDLQPSLDDGRFPIKRTVGESVVVTVAAVADGHDRLGLALRYRPGEDGAWAEVAMTPGGDDRWQASFTVVTLQPHFYTVSGWVDQFLTWREGLLKKHQAGVGVALELQEGAILVREAAARAASSHDREELLAAADALAGASPPPERVARAAAPVLAALMRRHADRAGETRYDRILAVDVNRERARVGAWYEMFPRSLVAGDEPGLRAAAARLPAIATMGFDVLYLPPVHPIGRTHRKGRNNAIAAAPDDPGSPWAIGAEAGGHTAVDPQLGTLADFDRFHAAVRDHGLELALDLAFQCSPDHPWVREHPTWFKQRPDGSVQYAENPPKKYQDIYPLNFASDDWRDLWQALLEVTLFWVTRGVRIFRVDNPHTKPLRFWQWLIAGVKESSPDTIFLSEAFTRPLLMQALAKAGFDQSYTYFTWRNTRDELTGYLLELTGSPLREYLRPNFFANTPDILPQYLQYGGRPAFKIRLVLAATLAASYGIYSGYELAENLALPGTEEYLDSEKYERRPRDYDAPGNLQAFIARVNAIRRANPALHWDHRLRFHPVDNDQLLVYSKCTADLANIILVAVNLDPHHRHGGWLEVPLDRFELRAGVPYDVHDLLTDHRFIWRGARNYVELDPAATPARILRLSRPLRTERDFDYYR